MKKAKHLGFLWALAVALGVGMAVVCAPAVAWAAPDDSGTGSSPGDSSPSGSSGLSGATNDAPSGHRRPLNSPGDTPGNSGGLQTSAKTGLSGAAITSTSTRTPLADARQRGGETSHPALVNAAGAETTGRDSSLDFTRPEPQSDVATPVSAPLTAVPVSSPVTAPATAQSPPVPTLINAVLSPIPTSAPTAPAQEPAAFTLLAFARRDGEQGIFSAPTTVDPLASQVTNGLVTDTVGGTSDTSSAVDPDFISSTRNFGLFSLTSAGDPSDNNYVAFVLSTPIFTFVLTSGTDPEDNLGFGAASIGVAGNTVGTFISPFLNFSIAIPIEDPFAELFIDLIRLGLV